MNINKLYCFKKFPIRTKLYALQFDSVLNVIKNNMFVLS